MRSVSDSQHARVLSRRNVVSGPWSRLEREESRKLLKRRASAAPVGRRIHAGVAHHVLVDPTVVRAGWNIVKLGPCFVVDVLYDRRIEALLRRSALPRPAHVPLQEYQRCLRQQTSLGIVLRDTSLGMRAGAEGTPSLFLNGEHLPGIRDAAQLHELLRSALRKAGSQGSSAGSTQKLTQ